MVTEQAQGAIDPASRPGNSFRADIQGIRAVAVGVVVLFHAGMGFSGGFVGVDIFFVVSGFVITKMLRNEQMGSGAISLGTFYLRRIRRLLPALALILIVVLLTAPLLGPGASGPLTRRTGASAAVFVSNVSLMRAEHGYFDLDAAANPLLHLWSLSVEEQFYLGFPFLMVLAWAALKRTRRPVVGLATLLSFAAVASFGLNLLLMSGRSPFERGYAEQIAFFASPPRAWEFLVGAVLSLTPVRLGPRAADVGGLMGLALVGTAVFTFDSGTAFPGLAAVVPVLGTALLLAAGTPPGARVAQILGVAPLRRIGDLSYSWYLWHWPLIVFARAAFPGSGWAAPAAALVSVGPAWISHTWVETPIRVRRRPRPLVTVGLGLACIALPLASVLASAGIDRSLPNEVREYSAAFGPHSYQDRMCDAASSKADPVACTWQLPEGVTPQGRVVLIGDSNAGQYSEAFVASAEQLHLTATVQTRSSCEFIDLSITLDGAVDPTCRSFYRTRMAWLLRTTPDVVVIAGVSDLRIEDPSVRMAPTAAGPWVQGASEKAEIWTQGLERTLTRLQKAGIRTVTVHPLPRFPGWPDPNLCANALVIIDQGRCGTSASEEAARDYARRALQAEARAVSLVPGSKTLDLWPELCSDGDCRTFRDGIWWFRDWNHLTASGSLELARPLTAAVEEALSQPARG